MTGYAWHGGVSPIRRAGEKSERMESPMPGNVAPVADEREGLMRYLAEQRDVLRIASYGLTDEQARLAPPPSTLSIGA